MSGRSGRWKIIEGILASLLGVAVFCAAAALVIPDGLAPGGAARSAVTVAAALVAAASVPFIANGVRLTIDGVRLSRRPGSPG